MNRANLVWNIENQITDTDGKFAGKVYEKEVVVSSAELLALRATPKELVAAPGTGKVLQFMGAVGFLDYNSETYANNGDLTINYTDNDGTAVCESVAGADLFHQVDDCYTEFAILSANTELTANAALVLVEAGGEAITGDSPITIKIFYRILDFS